MTGKTGYISCGAYGCKAILPDTTEERNRHLRTEHPDLVATIYLPCDPPPEEEQRLNPEEETCSSTAADPPASPGPDAPHAPAAD